jgi:hypothetical protein
VLRSLYTSKFNEIKQSELSFVQTALEEQATELDHLIEIRDCIKACTDCIVEFLEVDIFNVMDLVLFLQKSLDKREETDEE